MDQGKDSLLPRLYEGIQTRNYETKNFPIKATLVSPQLGGVASFLAAGMRGIEG